MNVRRKRYTDFLVERLCPELAPAELKRHPQLRDIAFPLTITVEKLPQQNETHGCTSALVYRVHDEQAQKMRKQYGLLAARRRFVCEHMGRIIE